MLDFRTKRGLQKQVAEQQTILESGPAFKAKRQAQKLMDEALTKLGAGTAPAPADPAEQAFLQSLIDRREDLLADGILERFRDIAVRAAGELVSLAEQARPIVMGWLTAEFERRAV